MPFRLFKMDIQGKVAVANLLLVGNLPGVDAFSATRVLRKASQWWRLLPNTRWRFWFFPVGWLAQTSHGLFSVIFVPLNAYLWGKVVETILEKTQEEKKRPRPRRG